MAVVIEVYMLACVMVGEAEVLGDTAMLWVGQVALNRVADPRFPSSLHQVLEDGFAGWGRPDDRAVALAEGLMACQSVDVAVHDYLWVYSLQDVERLGFVPGDRVLGGLGRYRLHFYRGVPLKKVPGSNYRKNTPHTQHTHSLRE